MNPVTSTSDGKYIHLIGRALIGKDEAGNFTVTLLGADRQPIPGSLPITFSDLPFELINMHLVAEMGQKELGTYQATLSASTHSFVELEDSKEAFATCMTSTDPPCSNKINTSIVPIPAPRRSL